MAERKITLELNAEDAKLMANALRARANDQCRWARHAFDSWAVQRDRGEEEKAEQAYQRGERCEARAERLYALAKQLEEV